MPKVQYEKRDRIAYVTINRPEARNAIDPDVHRLMIETWADFRDDDSLDVAILTGAGDDAFCAGADLKTYIPPIMQDASPAEIREIVELGLNGFTRGMHRIYKPIVAAVNGWALAGGLETALACDIRIASERAMFGSFEARRGFHHGDGGLVRLVNACGVSVASHMLLTAEPVDAAPGARVGPGHEGRARTTRLLEEAETVARQILRNSQRAVRSAKQTILDVIGQPLDAQLRTEAWNAYTCADPEETLELLGRFYDKSDAGRAGATRRGSDARPSGVAGEGSTGVGVARPCDSSLRRTCSRSSPATASRSPSRSPARGSPGRARPAASRASASGSSAAARSPARRAAREQPHVLDERLLAGPQLTRDDGADVGGHQDLEAVLARHPLAHLGEQ